MRILFRNKRILWTSTLAELRNRYAGSLLGKLWILLYPALLLSIYLFVYVAIFKMRFPGQSQMDYVIFVFSGLVPYIGFMEAVSSGCMSVKQNIHLVKNVIMPIDLIPPRAVLASMVSQAVSMVILVGLTLANGSGSPHLLLLPVVFALQILFLCGLVWILASLAVVLPDTSHFVGLFLLLLLFVSPIGFDTSMVPEQLRAVIYANPLHYMIDAYRSIILHGRLPEPFSMAIYVAICLATFWTGATFFNKFKAILVDYE